MVAFMRGSSPGRKSVMHSIRLDASRLSLPKACVNAPACSLHPWSRMASRIRSRVAVQLSTRCSAPSLGARAIARSSATQHISLEYRKSRSSPRISQMPLSFSVHRLAAVSAAAARNWQVTGSRSASWSVSRWAALSSSPYTSSCRWVQAPLPTRTGRLSRQPARCGSSRSDRSRSPPIPNMICRSSPRRSWDAPASARKVKNLFASSGQAATHNASMVRLASRTQV
jgi:hypothetical protein